MYLPIQCLIFSNVYVALSEPSLMLRNQRKKKFRKTEGINNKEADTAPEIHKTIASYTYCEKCQHNH